MATGGMGIAIAALQLAVGLPGRRDVERYLL